MKTPDKIDPDKASYQSVWRFNIFREGRWAEYEASMAAKQAQHKNWSTCLRETMTEMGYKPGEVEKERQKAREFLGLTPLAQAQRIVAKAGPQADPLDDEAYNAAFRGLPPTAPTSQELEWVGSHPAMGIRARTAQVMHVVLKAKDLLDGEDHALCPSKRAALSLAFWVNHPMEFHRAMIGEQKKTQTTQGEVKQESDTTLDDVRKLMAQMGN